jgi:predicted nucleic acid-binding protein
VIVLDTNVLSALMQQQPDAQVVAWLDKQPAESIWISSITLFEARYGLALLAAGQRKSLLQERFDQLLQDDLENRVLLFDANAATQAAQVAAERKARGRPVDMRDTFIAGIALARRATLATRNTRHFDDLSVPVVNPWTDSE